MRSDLVERMALAGFVVMREERGRQSSWAATSQGPTGDSGLVIALVIAVRNCIEKFAV
jgi:hypothetical protein